jgi:hypothetical protein
VPVPKSLQPALAPKQGVSLEEEEDEHEEVVDDTHVGRDTAMKFLLAGGVAGAGAQARLSSLPCPP